MILLAKTWDDPSYALPDETILPLAERILAARGVSDPVERSAFLSGEPPKWHDPFLLPDMQNACTRIRSAIANRERILVFGDYDADGVTATALLLLFLRKAGADCRYMIPDRVSEGYGMSEALFSRIDGFSPSLMITVDCGISDVDEISTLMRSGIDVIVTDHHEVKPILPQAIAVVSAKRVDSLYPFTQLSGVGIALKLIEALSSFLYPLTEKNDFEAFFDLAMLGTIADVVPLVDENRTIVRKGLRQLHERGRLGITSLIEVAGQREKELNSISISYLIVPRINASGRMGDAARAVELLTTDDSAKAAEIAALLTSENARRQEIELDIFQKAIARIEGSVKEGEVSITSAGPIVLLGDDWHPGVIGIVASRLVSRYGRPAIVFTKDSGQPDLYKGSARSVDGFNILEAIIFAKEHAAQFGGHPKAAGIAVEASHFSGFCKMLEEYSLKTCEEGHGVAALRPDARLSVEEISLSSFREIQRLAPFGESNAEPIFLLENLTIEQAMSCGSGKHLKLKVSVETNGKNRQFDAIGFGFGALEDLYTVGSKIDILYSLTSNVWRDKESLSLMIRDIRFSKTGRMVIDSPDILETLYQKNLGLRQLAILAKTGSADIVPTREDFKRVYQFLRTNCTEGSVICDANLLARKISLSYKESINGFQLLRILDVFAEASLIQFHSRKGQRICFSLLFVEGKVKLENTKTYQRMFS